MYILCMLRCVFYPGVQNCTMKIYTIMGSTETFPVLFGTLQVTVASTPLAVFPQEGSRIGIFVQQWRYRVSHTSIWSNFLIT